MKGTRVTALLMAVLMVCVPLQSWAEGVQSGTDLQPTATVKIQVTATPEATTEMTITPAPTEEITQTPAVTETPSPAPEETPTSPPVETWQPSGQAWAETDGGEKQAGKLSEILAWLCAQERQDAKATLRLLTTQEITVTAVPRKLLERVVFEPDSNAFDLKKYEVVMTIEDDGQTDTVVLRVQVIRKNQATPVPTATPTATPGLAISVSVDDYTPGQWSSISPWFALSGIPEGDRSHVYGVFLCDRELIILSDGSNCYVPRVSGAISVRFAILDMMGDVVSLSSQYDVLLDFTPPEGPYLSLKDGSTTQCLMEASDSGSGLAAYSLDGGRSWIALSGDTASVVIDGERGSTIAAGMIQVRDAAGNVSANEESFYFGQRYSGGGGSGTQAVRHVTETLDYSTANYNALELIFPEEAQTQLTAGDETLNLTLCAGSDAEAQPFTAYMMTWQKTPDETPENPNVLVLTSSIAEDASTWRFSGDVYRLLYNSGVELMILATGEYITVIPTEGFTGGTQYSRLKASGVSTKKFAYTITQDEALLETTISVQVEDETYLLEEDTASVMYRYSVLIGSWQLLEEPYATYLPAE